MKIADTSPLELALDLVASTYGFKSIRIKRILAGGMFARPVLLETDRGLFVHRVHTFRSTEQAFRFQAETIDSVWRQGVSCSRVEPTPTGRWCTPMDSVTSVEAVHRFVEGQCDDWIDWHHRKRTQSGFLHSLGCKVAKLHNALACATPGGDSGLDLSLPPIQFRHIERIRAEWPRDVSGLRRQVGLCARNAREQLLSLASRIEKHWEWLTLFVAKVPHWNLPTQIVHGDISPVNMVARSDGQIAFIDWDSVHIGHRMYDAMGDVLNRPPHDRPSWNRFNWEEIDKYVDGYASCTAQPLTILERQMMPAFCLARQLEDLRQRLRAIPTIDPSDDDVYATLIGMRVAMMDQIADS
jgi:aminoglycoside phosphotransferase (APT) family kinase protein